MLALDLAVGMVVGTLPGLGPGVVVALFIPQLARTSRLIATAARWRL